MLHYSSASIPQPDCVSGEPLRYWEIDAVRGMAIVFMVSFHFVWDLHFAGLTRINVFSAPWQIFARSIGATFLFLLGFSLYLRASQGRLSLLYTVQRGGLLLSLGVGISLITYFVVGNSYVRFGILHVLGISTLILPPFIRMPSWIALFVGVVVISFGTYLNMRTVFHPWFIWLGIPQYQVVMVDYYPLLPWFGVALLGVVVARHFYPCGIRSFALPDRTRQPGVRALRWLSRRSLSIYLLHQPILLGLVLTLRSLLSHVGE